jgi:hypothetical protein
MKITKKMLEQRCSELQIMNDDQEELIEAQNDNEHHQNARIVELGNKVKAYRTVLYDLVSKE